MIRLDPITRDRLTRFQGIRRGWWSALILMALIVFTLVAELFVNSRALIVHYQGELYFPTYGAVIPGTTFGEDYAYETNYKLLKKRFADEGAGNWVLMPPVPFDPYEINSYAGEFPPHAPNMERAHYLGTDIAGRDVTARLVYGFRIAIWFSIALLASTYVIGIILGCLMGYRGGWFDLVVQRLIEVWSNVPFLYIIMIVASIVTPDFGMLVFLMVIFGWMGMTWYMRTATYKEVSRDYVMAAKALGASDWRIITTHILPNTVSVIVTFIPFSVAGGITALTALDYLGFGLPPPTPSWGELLKQGTDRLDAAWIVTSVVSGLVLVLVMVTFVGEAIREAFDPRRLTRYE